MIRLRPRRAPRPLGLHQSFHWRLAVLALFFLVLLAAIAVRVFALAIVEHRKFVRAARRQQEIARVLPSLRGTIYAQDKSGTLTPLAVQKSFFTLTAVPQQIEDAGAAASALAPILGQPQSAIAAKLGKRDDPYEVLARKLGEETAGRLRALGIAGLNLLEEPRRIYPQGRLAAPVVGFVSYEDGEERGEYGIEKHFERHLKGERGFFAGVKDAAGSWVALGRRILNPPVNGESVVLTIDPNIQFRLEAELTALLSRWQAGSAAGIIMEPKTGRILAAAAVPSFDSNRYSDERDFSVFRMPLFDSQFELGSVFKPITMAAGIQEGVVTATTTYRDPGTVRMNGFTISNFDGRAHGTQTMTQVLEQSLNTGAIFVGQRLGRDRFFAAVRRFGFGAKAGVDFPGEVGGDISNLPAGRDVDYATAAFGQGIAVTPLQMAFAIGAIANGGTLMRPYIVEKVMDSSGSEEVRRPEAVSRVVDGATAETVTKMLVSVVRNGYDNRAGVKGYFVAGKTGTAQIPLSSRRGYSLDVIHTFVGYAPAFDPRFLALVQLNRPLGNRFAANTLSPTFSNLAAFILSYYEVPPDEVSP